MQPLSYMDVEKNRSEFDGLRFEFHVHGHLQQEVQDLITPLDRPSPKSPEYVLDVTFLIYETMILLPSVVKFVIIRPSH